ncbi:hypothetical protein [Caldimonas tepidiphila]|uniref:hypothetical protein n=1 Tax=Caldimonas tepidiphila TaxID=2315841 RepID=UPI000E5B31B3|nr:hypothetical protein [Caldimonas tepidiphila]
MLNRIKRWLTGSAPSEGLQSVKAWAQGRGYQYRDGDESWGFSVEGRRGSRPWRMEYGRPQRNYIEHAELRLRLDLGLPPTLNLMLLSRPLLEQLESTALERFSRGHNGRLELAATEEMRWLALYPKVALHAVSDLRRHFGMVGSSPEAAHHWLHGALGERLEALQGTALAGLPLALMVVRGCLHLRIGLQEPALPALQEALALFLVAAEQAQEVLLDWADDNDGTWLSTTSIAWQGGELHVELPLDLPPPKN